LQGGGGTGGERGRRRNLVQLGSQQEGEVHVAARGGRIEWKTRGLRKKDTEKSARPPEEENRRPLVRGKVSKF